MRRVLVVAATVFVITAAPAVAAGPTPGAAGLGDRLNLGIGNGGYDVQHYDLDIRYATSAPSQSIEGTATILARATQSLSRFNLDFAGASVGSVSVDGSAAAFRREGEELVITPRKPLRDGEHFLVQVKRFVAVPTEPGEDPTTQAFMFSPDGSFTAPQPYYAHFIYPSNDHPRDKATYTFRIDAPAGATVAASGIPIGPLTFRGRSHWVFVQRQPMATELDAAHDGPLEGHVAGAAARRAAARPHAAGHDRAAAAQARAAAGAFRLARALPRALSVRRLRHAGGRRGLRLPRAGDADAHALRPRLPAERASRACGSRR